MVYYSKQRISNALKSEPSNLFEYSLFEPVSIRWKSEEIPCNDVEDLIVSGFPDDVTFEEVLEFFQSYFPVEDLKFCSNSRSFRLKFSTITETLKFAEDAANGSLFFLKNHFSRFVSQHKLTCRLEEKSKATSGEKKCFSMRLRKSFSFGSKSKTEIRKNRQTETKENYSFRFSGQPNGNAKSLVGRTMSFSLRTKRNFEEIFFWILQTESSFRETIQLCDNFRQESSLFHRSAVGRRDRVQPFSTKDQYFLSIPRRKTFSRRFERTRKDSLRRLRRQKFHGKRIDLESIGSSQIRPRRKNRRSVFRRSRNMGRKRFDRSDSISCWAFR